MNPYVAVLIFVIAIVTDVVWARYTMSVSDRRPVHATLFALGIVACAAANFGAYLHSLWYFVPTAAGSAVGTYATVRHAKRSA